jgi:hypothetical protein
MEESSWEVAELVNWDGLWGSLRIERLQVAHSDRTLAFCWEWFRREWRSGIEGCFWDGRLGFWVVVAESGFLEAQTGF